MGYFAVAFPQPQFLKFRLYGQELSRIKDSMLGVWMTKEKRLKLYGLSLEMCKLQADIDVLLFNEDLKPTVLKETERHDQ